MVYGGHPVDMSFMVWMVCGITDSWNGIFEYALRGDIKARST